MELRKVVLVDGMLPSGFARGKLVATRSTVVERMD